MPHGIRRDPDTGRFVAAGDSVLEDFDWNDTEELMGDQAVTIPAADLSGGTTRHTELSAEAAIIDFGSAVAQDEVFALLSAEFRATLSFPTTATGEGSAVVHGMIGHDRDLVAPHSLVPSFYSGNTSYEDGVYDVVVNDGSSWGRFWSWYLTGAAGFGDSTNGLGAADVIDAKHAFIPYPSVYGMLPLMDADDEWFGPLEIATDNISDHAVVNYLEATLRGIVLDIDRI